MKFPSSFIILFFSLGISFPLQAIEKAIIDVVDTTPFHIHSDQEKTFSIVLSRSKTFPVYYQWRDYLGHPLTDKKPLTAMITFLRLPSTVPGYYGLVFTATEEVVINDREQGEALEFGFGMIDPARIPGRQAGETERFGTVHTDLNDPFMPAWIKTMTWKTVTSQEWKNEISERLNSGFQELPIIIDDEWQSDDDFPISDDQLDRLSVKVSQYFRADPRVKHWELGIEENLQARFQQPCYWQNLAAKAAVVRQAADQISPNDIKLIYQVAELDIKPVRLFLKSEAAQYFDILSLHPYNWPDFPPPETWIAAYLDKVRNEMKKTDQTFPIWFTEVGAPHHGHYKDHFFGYPDEGIKVHGLSRSQSVSYMIKLHVIAFQQGVQKIFWYNYRDQEPDRDDAENHFGLIDYKGYPKPVYLAYVHLYSLLKDKQPAGMSKVNEHVLVYRFEDQTGTLFVVWNRTPGKRKVQLKKLGLDPDKASITNAVGKPEPMTNGMIEVGESPSFIFVSK